MIHPVGFRKPKYRLEQYVEDTYQYAKEKYDAANDIYKKAYFYTPEKTKVVVNCFVCDKRVVVNCFVCDKRIEPADAKPLFLRGEQRMKRKIKSLRGRGLLRYNRKFVDWFCSEPCINAFIIRVLNTKTRK